MKYKIGDTISINNTDWVIAEHRMGRGREWVYTLAHEDTDGSFTVMRLNEMAIDGIIMSGGFSSVKV